MTRLPSLSSDKIVRALQQKGFRYAPKRGKGSHVALVGTTATDGRGWQLSRRDKDVPTGRLLSILEQAGLTREEFLELI